MQLGGQPDDEQPGGEVLGIAVLGQRGVEAADLDLIGEICASLVVDEPHAASPRRVVDVRSSFGPSEARGVAAAVEHGRAGQPAGAGQQHPAGDSLAAGLDHLHDFLGRVARRAAHRAPRRWSPAGRRACRRGSRAAASIASAPPIASPEQLRVGLEDDVDRGEAEAATPRPGTGARRRASRRARFAGTVRSDGSTSDSRAGQRRLSPCRRAPERCARQRVHARSLPASFTRDLASGVMARPSVS